MPAPLLYSEELHSLKVKKKKKATYSGTRVVRSHTNQSFLPRYTRSVTDGENSLQLWSKAADVGRIFFLIVAP